MFFKPLVNWNAISYPKPSNEIRHPTDVRNGTVRFKVSDYNISSLSRINVQRLLLLFVLRESFVPDLTRGYPLKGRSTSQTSNCPRPQFLTSSFSLSHNALLRASHISQTFPDTIETVITNLHLAIFSLRSPIIITSRS